MNRQGQGIYRAGKGKGVLRAGYDRPSSFASQNNNNNNNNNKIDF